MKKFLNNKILNKKIQIKHRSERSGSRPDETIGPVHVSNFIGPKISGPKNLCPSNFLEKKD